MVALCSHHIARGTHAPESACVRTWDTPGQQTVGGQLKDTDPVVLFFD